MIDAGFGSCNTIQNKEKGKSRRYQFPIVKYFLIPSPWFVSHEPKQRMKGFSFAATSPARDVAYPNINIVRHIFMK